MNLIKIIKHGLKLAGGTLAVMLSAAYLPVAGFLPAQLAQGLDGAKEVMAKEATYVIIAGDTDHYDEKNDVFTGGCTKLEFGKSNQSLKKKNGASAAFVTGKNHLYLDNYKTTGLAGYEAGKNVYGIYADGDIIIHARGNVELCNTDSDKDKAYGIYVYGNCKLGGTNKETKRVANMKINMSGPTSYGSYGIYTVGGLDLELGSSIDEFNLNIKAGDISGDIAYSIAINVGDDHLNISGGNIEAVAGDTTQKGYSQSQGIYANCDINITGGNIKATSGKAKSSRGIELVRNNTVLNMNGGTLIAKGAPVTVKNGESYGAYIKAIDLTKNANASFIAGDAVETGISVGLSVDKLAISEQAVLSSGAGDGGKYSLGAWVKDSVDIIGGESEFKSGNSADIENTKSYALYFAGSKDKFVVSGGKLMAVGSDKESTSCGIRMGNEETLNLTGGRILAKGMNEAVSGAAEVISPIMEGSESYDGSSASEKTEYDKNWKYALLYNDKLTVNIQNWYYGYTGIEPSWTPSVSGTPVIRYEGRNGTVYASSTTPPTEAGDYKVTVTFTGEGVSGSADFSIEKLSLTTKNVKLTLDEEQGVYNGEEQSAKYSLKLKDAEIDASEYTVTGDKATDVEPTTLVITAAEDGNFEGSLAVVWELQKLDPVSTHFQMIEWPKRDYTGEPVEPLGDPVLKEPYSGLGEVTIYYQGDGSNTIYDKTTEPPTDAGFYQVEFDVSEGKNFKSKKGIRYPGKGATWFQVSRIPYDGTKDIETGGQIGVYTILDLSNYMPADADIGALNLGTGTENLDGGTVTIGDDGRSLEYKFLSTTEEGTEVTLRPSVTDSTNYKSYVLHVKLKAEHIHSIAKVTDAKAPTCTESGNIEYYRCNLDGCGKLFKNLEGSRPVPRIEDTVVPAMGHEWDEGDVTEAPSCTETGAKTYTCKHDKSHTKTEEVPATGHTPGTWTVMIYPDCGNTGTRVTKCTVCGEELTAEVPTVGKHFVGHVDKRDPGCETWGCEEHYYCGKCKHMFKDAEATIELSSDDVFIEPLGHEWDEGTVEEEATCLNPGVKKLTCTRNHEHEMYEEIPATDHKWGDPEVVREPNCTFTGETVIRCINTGCGEEIFAETLPNGKHSPKQKEAKAATCTVSGNIAHYECEFCGALFKDAAGTQATTLEEVTENAPGHKWGGWTVIKAATDTEAGSRSHECTVCHEKETEVIPVGGGSGEGGSGSGGSGGSGEGGSGSGGSGEGGSGSGGSGEGGSGSGGSGEGGSGSGGSGSGNAAVSEDRVPLSKPDEAYAAPLDNIAPSTGAGNIAKLTLDLSGVKASKVAPSDLKMTVIKGTKIALTSKLKDKDSASVTGGIKVKVNKKNLLPTIICKKDGTATLTMEDGETYTITFTVEKPGVVKTACTIAAGSGVVTRTPGDLFGTKIDSGIMVIVSQKYDQASLSGNTLTINPKEKDTIKVQYVYLNKKYKAAIKVK